MKIQIKFAACALLLATLNPQLSTCFAQGSLTPPGTPAPTMKTLDQVEARSPISSLPYTISQPGSYYLTTNLTGSSGASGIIISSGSVTLDLNGFALTGVAGSTNGIRVSNVYTNITVRNGTVNGWGKTGVYAPLAVSSQFIDLRASDNGLGGIVGGQGNNRIRCVAAYNQLLWLTSDSGSTFQDCTATGNLGDGFDASNGGQAFNDCTATGNTNYGFFIGGWGLVNKCTANGNGSSGFRGGRGARFSECHASQNGQAGFDAGYGNSVSGCTTSDNTGDGITVGYRCFIHNNECYANGAAVNGAGIHLTLGGSRIEGNHVAENYYGIKADVAGNFIIHNSASGNTADFSITGSQSIGPIVSGDSMITTNNPWANFSF